MRSEVASLNDDIHNFKLTVHCSSVDNLIDLDKLKEFHQSERDTRLNKIVEQWMSRDDEERTYDAFFEELKRRPSWMYLVFTTSIGLNLLISLNPSICQRCAKR